MSKMRSLAVGLARHHVRADSILPGWMDTDMIHKWLQRDTVNKHLLRRIPARRRGQPIDFGPIAIYLVSDASAYHTGDTFVIDGGLLTFLNDASVSRDFVAITMPLSPFRWRSK